MTLLSWLEPEELIGRRWHRWISRDTASYPHHPAAAARLDDIAPSLAVFFRGLGGDAGVQIAASAARTSGHRLTWKQKLGLAEEQLDRPSLDDAVMFLPDSIDVFPAPEMNRRLYFWLAAFFTRLEAPSSPLATDDPMRRDLAFLRQVYLATQQAMTDFPGLTDLHSRLCRAIVAVRPKRDLPRQERTVEDAVLSLLEDVHAGPAWDYVRTGQGLDAFSATAHYKPFLPVPLWGEINRRAPESLSPEQGDAPDMASADGEEQDQKKRRAGRKQQDQAERSDSLILNRFDKILSLAEMINVNRDVDDDDEESARKAAEELEQIVVTRHQRKPAVKLKLDLDLSPDDILGPELTGTYLYPEWDYRSKSYHKNHCRVLTAPAEEEGESWAPDEAALRRIRLVRRQFEALRPKAELLRAQADGEDLDIEAVVRSRCDLLASGVGSDRVFVQMRKTARDLSVAFLLDVSLSTDAWVQNRRILDMEKEALTTFCRGLEACGDEHAVFTFTSRKRDMVNVLTVKDFDEPSGARVERRIAALKPGYYTRIGAAIRHVTKQLEQRPHRHRLLMLLTDGKPNDVDHYDGRYGVEDTRKAVQEARRAGLAVFGITIDRKAQDYFPHLFGRGSFAIIDDISRLSAALPKIYRQLVTQ